MVEIAMEDARGDVMPDKHMAIVKVFLLWTCFLTFTLLFLTLALSLGGLEWKRIKDYERLKYMPLSLVWLLQSMASSA